MKLNKALLGGSIILVVTFGIFNFLNYFYHLGMLRLLTVSEYGVLATLLSLIYIASIFTESMQTVLAKYAATEHDKGKTKNIFMRSLRKAVAVGLGLFVIFLIGAYPLSILLKIPFLLLAVTGVIVFAIFLTAVGRGILQGRQQFKTLGMTMVLEGVVKLILGIAFVYIGWNVYGAIIGATLSVIAAFIYILYVLRPILNATEVHAQTPRIYRESLPVFIITFTILVFYNLDILMAKIVFDNETAGLYAITAIIAKTIFFATQPISKAMFPMTANQGKWRQKSNVFRTALAILVGCIALALIAFYSIPQIIIFLFTGKSLPEVQAVLIYAAIAASLIALTNLVVLYRLSQGRISYAWIFILFVVVEAVLLYTFSANLMQFVLALMTSAAIFLWGSVMLLRE